MFGVPCGVNYRTKLIWKIIMIERTTMEKHGMGTGSIILSFFFIHSENFYERYWKIIFLAFHK